MTTTVLELIENLKHYPSATEVTIKDVDDVEFAFVDFVGRINGLTIVIGESEDGEPDEEEK